MTDILAKLLGRQARRLPLLLGDGTSLTAVATPSEKEMRGPQPRYGAGSNNLWSDNEDFLLLR